MTDTPKITATENGPYKVEGVSTVTLADGTQTEEKKVMFLCRCGHSANKPFCDGSHKREGWTG